VRQSVIKVLDIVDARCNHEVYKTLLFLKRFDHWLIS